MLAIESLHRNFSGVCKEASATPLARYLAWRCVSAMPSELSPGFDERALGDAYEDLATLLGQSGADSSDVHVWAVRSRYHGCLPKWRLDWEGGSGLFAEDSAPTGPLEGVDLFGNGLGREAWASKARELAQRLTGMRLWLPALSSARKQTACLDALERSLGHIGSKGLDWRLGFARSVARGPRRLS